MVGLGRYECLKLALRIMHYKTEKITSGGLLREFFFGGGKNETIMQRRKFKSELSDINRLFGKSV